jgi:hypothetical protein
MLLGCVAYTMSPACTCVTSLNLMGLLLWLYLFSFLFPPLFSLLFFSSSFFLLYKKYMLFPYIFFGCTVHKKNVRCPCVVAGASPANLALVLWLSVEHPTRHLSFPVFGACAVQFVPPYVMKTLVFCVSFVCLLCVFCVSVCTWDTPVPVFVQPLPTHPHAIVGILIIYLNN